GGQTCALLIYKVTTHKDGYMHDLFPNAGSSAKSWGDTFDDKFSFDFLHFLTQSLWIIGILLLIYLFFIMLRHRHGEQAPVLNDYEAYKLKKEIIDNTRDRKSVV